MPPESFLQVLVHLGSSRVDGIRSVVGFLQDQVLQLHLVWYADATFVPNNPVLVFGESRGLAQLHLPLDAFDACVSILCLLDVVHQGRSDFQMIQKSRGDQFQTELFEFLKQGWLPFLNNGIQGASLPA